MTWNLIHADILDWAASYTGPKFHAVLTDPPYHMTEMTRRFGKEGSAPAQHGTNGLFQRASRGFMGKEWDGGDIAFRPELWAAIGQHLHPGAFLMAFASSRGWHRLAVAIEDAGFVIHPTMFCWAYGSGFPKATRIDPQLDRRAGAERPVVGTRKHAPKFNAQAQGYREKDNGYNSRDRETFELTGPASEESAAWEGYRYGLQAIKPAVEPIIVAQWPYEGAPVECINTTGAGALNIDGARIGTEQITINRWSDGAKPFGGGAGHDYDSVDVSGRWPANLILSCSPECNGEHAPDCPALLLDEQSGTSKSSNHTRHNGANKSVAKGADLPHTTYGHDDEGGASRFFYQAPWALDVVEQLAQADPVRYVAKASTAERNAGLETMPEQTVDDGRKKTADNAYQRGATLRKNIHPTVKPIALARYLATLLLPPARYAPRRILVPFAGSGSEMIGASLAGWNEVHGIERDAEYIAINEARNQYWAGWHSEDAQKVLDDWVKHEAEPTTSTEKPSMLPLPLVFERDAV